MEAILHNANNVATLFSALEALPSGVADAYRITLLRIDAQSKGDSSLAKRVFTWLLYAGRKLSVEFIQCALAVSHEALSYKQGDRVPISLVLSACGGLVEVRENVHTGGVLASTPDEVSFIRESIVDMRYPVLCCRFDRLTFILFDFLTVRRDHTRIYEDC